jgi:hypothetical protein
MKFIELFEKQAVLSALRTATKVGLGATAVVGAGAYLGAKKAKEDQLKGKFNTPLLTAMQNSKATNA